MNRPTRSLRILPLSLILISAACGDADKKVDAAPSASLGDGAGKSALPPAPAAKAPAAEAPAPAEPAPEPPFAKVEGERGLRVNESGAFDGYTLIAPLCSKSIHLLDMKGVPVHTWATNYVPGGSTYFLPNGHLLRCAMVENNPRFHGGGIGGRIEELDWDGKVVWDFELASDQRTLHHDFSLMPNGNILAIAWEYHSPEEIFALGRQANRVNKEGLWCDVVLEIKPKHPSGGEIVWTWRTFDHLVQDMREGAADFGALKAFPGRIDVNADHRYDKEETDDERRAREERDKQVQGLGYSGGKDVAKDAPNPADGKPADKPKDKYDADWLHMNAIEYLPEQDLIAVSTPHLCEVWVIDHSTTTKEAAGSSGGKRGHGGELIYRYGHSQNYGIGDDSSRILFYQHNVTWQKGAEPGELAMLLFNNGSHRPDKEFSEVEQFTLPFDDAKGFVREADKAFGPVTLDWKYSDPDKLFSPFISGAQRLPNGNTLVCEGARGRVLEVTSAGKIVWDFYNPLGGEIKPAEQAGKAPAKALFRATRLAKDHPGLKGKV